MRVSPGTLVAAIEPPCSETTAATIANPSPVLPVSRARGVATGEALEDAREQVGGDGGPVVAHLEPHPVAGADRAALDRCRLRSVTHMDDAPPRTDG